MRSPILSIITLLTVSACASVGDTPITSESYNTTVTHNEDSSTIAISVHNVLQSVRILILSNGPSRILDSSDSLRCTSVNPERHFCQPDNDTLELPKGDYSITIGGSQDLNVVVTTD